MKAFACPQCGASLESDATYNATAECPYCHSTVIVPPELRPPPPPPPPPKPQMFSNYEAQAAPKLASSVPRIVAFVLVGFLFIVFLILVLVTPNRKSTSPPYTPGQTRQSETAKVSPTPYTFTFGAEGTGPGLFQDAQDVAVDGEGNIFVSDDTLRVQKFSSKGEYISQWTVPSNTKYVTKIRGGPDRLLADRKGNVYVVIGGELLRYDVAKADWIAGATDSGHIYDSALKADGGIVVVSGNDDNDDLSVLDAQGKTGKRVHQFISTQLDKQIPVKALKVAVDGVGNIFAIYALGSVYGTHYYDNEDLAVFRFTADGKYVNRFGGGGKDPGQFDSPNAIAVDGQSRVYVCDLTGGISVFTADGRYVESLQTPYWVQGMAFDPADNLVIVGDNHVSKLVLKK